MIMREAKITHTDLKPDNVLLVVNDFENTPDGLMMPIDTSIKLVDFGLATYHDEVHADLVNI